MVGLRAFVVALLICTCVQGSSAEEAGQLALTIPPDASLMTAGYVELGIPEPSREWSAGEFRSVLRILRRLAPRTNSSYFRWLYWLIFPTFFMLMVSFVWPTIDKSMTGITLTLVIFLILTPTNERTAVLTFLAGSSLGYFLELWGTTRLCWIYYTLDSPPIFAVFAHGMAAVAFWRAGLLLDKVSQSWFGFKLIQPKYSPH